MGRELGQFTDVSYTTTKSIACIHHRLFLCLNEVCITTAFTLLVSGGGRGGGGGFALGFVVLIQLHDTAAAVAYTPGGDLYSLLTELSF